MKFRSSVFAIALLSLFSCSSDSGTGTNSGMNNDPGMNMNAGMSEEITDNTGMGASLEESAELLDSTTVAIPTGLENASSAYWYDYPMTSVTGATITARAQLFEPMGTAPADGFPTVVWAHGTTGIANACTPSNSFEDFGNAVAINGLLSAGYAVIAPDYEGFGASQIHPYYVRASHSQAVLASIPAAHQIPDTQLSDDWAVVGHSQGGHVALATARAGQLPSYPLQAVVALAPGTDLKPFSDRAFEAIDLAIANGELEEAGNRTFYMNVYGAFVAHALQLVNPEFDAASLFGDTMDPLIDTALDESYCGEYAQSVAAAIRQHVFNAGESIATFDGLKRDWYNDPLVEAHLNIEMFGDESQSMPLLIVQGDADQQVPVAATTAFVDQQRALGTDVTYQIISGARHGDVGRSEFNRTLEWLSEKFPPQ